MFSTGLYHVTPQSLIDFAVSCALEASNLGRMVESLTPLGDFFLLLVITAETILQYIVICTSEVCRRQRVNISYCSDWRQEDSRRWFGEYFQRGSNQAEEHN